MFTVYIKNIETGEVRQWVEKDKVWANGYDYLWIDGNYSCDCIRALLFARAHDECEENAWEQECGEDAFSVPFVELPDGTKIQIDSNT